MIIVAFSSRSASRAKKMCGTSAIKIGGRLVHHQHLWMTARGDGAQQLLLRPPGQAVEGSRLDVEFDAVEYSDHPVVLGDVFAADHSHPSAQLAQALASKTSVPLGQTSPGSRQRVQLGPTGVVKRRPRP
ncbi:hypothetical protein [Candidatus Accumulibacter sp. ACC003]|uniref:hypothetical protein n=1 Tax=Candidatus Accumulibacter sp. ACC003 TaxID=2823334 RepID=UPI0025BC006D|nr:hypothetical protein [Candidatus Accumulibacter sp. ACC003]